MNLLLYFRPVFISDQHWLELRGECGSDAGLWSSTYEVVTVSGSKFSGAATVFAASSQSGNSPQRASGWPVGPSLLLCCCCRSPLTPEPSAKCPKNPQPLQAQLLTAPRLKMTRKTGGWTHWGGAWSRSAATSTRSWSWWVGVMECANTAVATVGLFWLGSSLLWTVQCPIRSSLLENERFFIHYSRRRSWIPSDNTLFSCVVMLEMASQSSQSTFRFPAPVQHHVWMKRGLRDSNPGEVWSPGGLQGAALWERCRIWCFASPSTGQPPVPRPGYQMPEPDGCSSYFFGLPVPEGVRIHTISKKKKKNAQVVSFYLCWRWFFIGQMDMGIPAMTKCCNQLDMCYDTCGSNKYRCDSKFRWCLHSICSDLKKSLGFVSKVEGRFNLNLFVADVSQKQWKQFTSQWGSVLRDELNGGFSRERCLNQLFGTTDGNRDVFDTLERNPPERLTCFSDFLMKGMWIMMVNAVLSCLFLCFFGSVWNSGRHVVQHSLDSGLQTLHEQPEGSMLLSGGGKRRALDNYFQPLSYLQHHY